MAAGEELSGAETQLSLSIDSILRADTFKPVTEPKTTQKIPERHAGQDATKQPGLQLRTLAEHRPIRLRIFLAVSSACVGVRARGRGHAGGLLPSCVKESDLTRLP